MNNIISINLHPKRFPQGSRAIHRIHGWCEVLGVAGDKRTIGWVEHVPQPVEDAPEPSETILGIQAHELLEQEDIVWREGLVAAADLRAV